MELVSSGRVDDGIAELQRAYEILPHPNVLYNIARAYAEAGQYESAIEYFDRYLETDPPDREEVNGFLSALRERVAQQRARETPGPAQPEPTEPVQPEPPASPAATADEIQAIEDSATQIATLAEATQSDALRQRADRLRGLAANLRARSAAATQQPTTTTTTTTTTTAVVEPGRGGEEAGLELGGALEEDIYAETVVSASRFAQSPLDAPNSTAAITRQDIRLSGLTNIGELLRRVAGMDVMTANPGDVQTSMRGFNQRLSNKMLVLIDGRSIYLDPLGVTFWVIQPFNVEDIERIEVIRGPASALYGADAFSGIVNIITRPPGEESTEATLGYGTYEWTHGYVATSGRAARLGYRLSAGYNRANRFSLEHDGERVDRVADTPDPTESYDAAHVNGSLRYRVSRDVVATLSGGVSANDQEFQATGPLRDYFSTGSTSHAMGLVETPWGQVRTFWNHIDARAGQTSHYAGSDSLGNGFVGNTFDIEAELSREFHLLVDHNLHLGAGYRLKTIGWDYVDEQHDENHFAVFFQDTLRIFSQLIGVGSFRVDFHPLLDTPVFSPRGSLILRPTDTHAIHVTVGTAFRTPTFLETYLDLENPTPVAGVTVIAQGSEVARGGRALQPESILSAEIGYRIQEELFDFEVAAYYNQVKDLIVLSQIRPFRLHETDDTGYDPAVASFPLGTIGFENERTEFDVIGGEIGVRAYPVTGLDVYANYAINRAYVTGGEQIGRTEEERTSTHKINGGVQLRTPVGLDVGVDFSWVSDQVWLEQQFDRVEGVVYREFPLDGYYLLNARVGYRAFDDRLEIGVVGYNVTDHEHRQHPFGQVLRRRVMATLSYRF
jgi:outer membrane receptor protein involved in Fe transport